MKYLEFLRPNNINKIATNILESYMLVEGRINSASQKKIIAKIEKQLDVAKASLGTTDIQNIKVREVLKNAGFTGDYIDNLMKPFEKNLSKKTIQEPPESPEDENTPAEEPAAEKQPPATPEPVKEPPPPPSPPPFEIKMSNDNAKQVIKNLANQYPGVDQETEAKIRSLARSAIGGIDNNDSRLVYKAIRAQLDIIYAEISKKQPKTEELNEFASSGSSAAGSVASISAPLGAVISRMPAGQSFFAPTTVQKTKKSSKKKPKKR